MKVDSASDKQIQVSNDVAPTSWKKVRRRINIIEKMPMLFVSAQSRACLRAAGMENWRHLPLPGLYRADFGTQYAHHRHEVLLFG